MRKKIIAMIPARMGSKRVKNKNIRVLGDKPLVVHVIDAVKESGVFDEIYVNSESDLLGEIAFENGIGFYKRPPEFSTDSATNDEFALDFIKNNPCDILIQILPTSPFITSEEIKNFVDFMTTSNVETLISTKDVQIECVYKNSPINFFQNEKTLPSQQLEPIKAYACVLMGWDTQKFVENMSKDGCAYHGGDGTKSFFSISGPSTIDIDNEADFQMAEFIIGSINKSITKEPKYYIQNKKEKVEVNVPQILKKDGVVFNDFNRENLPLTHIEELIKEKPKNESWSVRLVNTENNSATLICQMPGEGNRRHYHKDWNEWWYIVDGSWEWEIEGELKTVAKGDLVFIEKNKWHKIKAIGDKPAIRLAVSREDVGHIYKDMRDKTAFIIGTGPSLKKIDMKKLIGEKTITFNRAYVAFDDWGFTPTYYLAIDGNDIRSCYKDINSLITNSTIEKFFLYKLTDNQKHSADCFQDNDFRSNDEIYQKSNKVILLNEIPGVETQPLINDFRLNENILTTSLLPNAGFMGLKALYFLGYRRIVLLGMDARYQDDASHRDVRVDGGAYEAKNDDDPNHFRSDYFGKNIMFGKPNQDQIIRIWKNFMERMSSNYPDLEIISCTENSNLNNFIKYIPFEEFMQKEK